MGGDPSADIIEAIHGLMHLFRSRQYHALQAGGYDLTHMESKVMGYFARHPLSTQSALVAFSGRDKSQLARLITALRDKGLLETQEDGEDRRLQRVQLTARGRKLEARVRAEARRLAQAAVQDLDSAEQARLMELLARVRASLEQAADGGQDAP